MAFMAFLAFKAFISATSFMVVVAFMAFGAEADGAEADGAEADGAEASSPTLVPFPNFLPERDPAEQQVNPALQGVDPVAHELHLVLEVSHLPNKWAVSLQVQHPLQVQEPLLHSLQRVPIGIAGIHGA
jgi:hypothetical protein